jgi:hypothetical protein
MVISIWILAFFCQALLTNCDGILNEATFFFVCYSVILVFSIVYTEWASVVETIWVCIQEILGLYFGHIIHYSG